MARRVLAAASGTRVRGGTHSKTDGQCARNSNSLDSVPSYRLYSLTVKSREQPPLRLGISELARQGAVNVATVRFYEQQGLLLKPPRTAAGYRVFSEDWVRRVRFIKRAQELGFTLREIKELLALAAEPNEGCAAFRALAETKLREIEGKIDDLNRMRGALARLTTACGGREAKGSCPILESLNDADAAQ